MYVRSFGASGPSSDVYRRPLGARTDGCWLKFWGPPCPTLSGWELLFFAYRELPLEPAAFSSLQFSAAGRRSTQPTESADNVGRLLQFVINVTFHCSERWLRRNIEQAQPASVELGISSTRARDRLLVDACWRDDRWAFE